MVILLERMATTLHSQPGRLQLSLGMAHAAHTVHQVDEFFPLGPGLSQTSQSFLRLSPGENEVFLMRPERVQ